MFNEEKINNVLQQAFIRYVDEVAGLSAEYRSEQYKACHDAIHILVDAEQIIRTALLKESRGEIATGDPKSGTSILINEITRLNKIRPEEAAYDLKRLSRDAWIWAANQLGISLDPSITGFRKASWMIEAPDQPVTHPVRSDRAKKILSSDLLIVDVIAPIVHTMADGEKVVNLRLQELVKKYQNQHPPKLTPGSKIALTAEEFEEFSCAMPADMTVEPGGSSANTLTTLSKLLGPEMVNIDFLGVVGKGVYSHKIAGAMEEANIRLLPPHNELPKVPAPEAAVSFVIVFPDGQRTIATYPGNAKEILKPEMIQPEMVEQSDIVLMQGSLWQKLQETPTVMNGFAKDSELGFADKLLKLRWDKGKDLWLTLPTQAKFGQEKAGLFKWLVETSNVVLGNDEELARIYTDPQDRDWQGLKPHENINFEEALRRIQCVFQMNVLEKKKQAGEWTGNTQQVAFITHGDKPAAIVTKDSIEYVEPVKLEKIINTLGAGDTAFAGFGAGMIKKMSAPEVPYKFCGQIAMALAGEKLKVNGPRLLDPQKSLRQASPYLARELLGMEKQQESESVFRLS